MIPFLFLPESSGQSAQHSHIVCWTKAEVNMTFPFPRSNTDHSARPQRALTRPVALHISRRQTEPQSKPKECSFPVYRLPRQKFAGWLDTKFPHLRGTFELKVGLGTHLNSEVSSPVLTSVATRFPTTTIFFGCPSPCLQ